MISFRKGSKSCPGRLAREIGDVRTGVAARRVLRTESGFRVETSAGPVAARRVVLAVPADAAARLLDEATRRRSRDLAEIPYAAVAVVSLGWRREDVGHPLDGFGFLVPRKEGLAHAGLPLPLRDLPRPRSRPGTSRSPPSQAAGPTPRSSAGTTTGSPPPCSAEVGRPLGCAASPPSASSAAGRGRSPSTRLGHGRFVDLAHEIERDLPGLRLGGNFLGGVSVPDCIRNATALAGGDGGRSSPRGVTPIAVFIHIFLAD